MSHLTALDAAFVELEDQHVALHIGSAAVFEGPVPTTAEVVDRYEHFAALHPRYRQVLARTPLDLRRPEWRRAVVDFDYHVRRTAVPAPGRRRQLEALVGRIMSTPLDPDRPLWEAWIVEGLHAEQWALVFKIHHSMVDGVGGMRTLQDLFDAGRGEPAVPPASAPRPPAESSPARALGRTSRRVVDAGRTVVGLPVAAARVVAGLPVALRALRFAPPSSLNGELGRARTYRAVTVDRTHVDTVRQRFGGTVNDVVLAMVASGFQGLFTARGESPAPGAVRCMVPVNVRPATDAGTESNKIAVVLVDLPVELSDARDIYLALRSRVRGVKRSSAAQVVETGLALADRVPSPVASAVLAAVRQLPQRIITTICTNVPGPRETQTFLGRRMVALYPYVPIADRIRIAVAVTSYDGRLHFGVTCDQASVRDADRFVEGMTVGLRDLVQHASGTGERLSGGRSASAAPRRRSAPR